MIDPFDVVIGRNIALRRTLMRMSQKDLARLLNTDERTLELYEQGKKTLTPELLRHLAHIFSCLIDDLYQRDDVAARSTLLYEREPAERLRALMADFSGISSARLQEQICLIVRIFARDDRETQLSCSREK